MWACLGAPQRKHSMRRAKLWLAQSGAAPVACKSTGSFITELFLVPGPYNQKNIIADLLACVLYALMKPMDLIRQHTAHAQP